MPLAPPPPPPTAEASLPGLAPIEGLDMQTGLHRALGREGLYRQLLGRFVRGQRGVPAAIDHALHAGDALTAERLAHTLKGVAGTIGALPLQEAAAELELAVRMQAPHERIGTRLAEVGALLEALVTALQSQLETHEAPATAAALPAGELRQRLAELLAQDDPEAANLMAEHEPLLRQQLGTQYDAVAQAVAAYDFELAAAALHG